MLDPVSYALGVRAGGGGGGVTPEELAAAVDTQIVQLADNVVPAAAPGKYQTVFARGYVSSIGGLVTNTKNLISFYFTIKKIFAFWLPAGLSLRIVWYSVTGAAGYLGHGERIVCGGMIYIKDVPDGATVFRLQIAKIGGTEFSDDDVAAVNSALRIYANTEYYPYNDAVARARFVSYMADVCAKLGMSATTFANASGLTSESQTTPADMLKLVVAIAGNPLAMDIWSTRDRDFTVGGANHREISVVSNVYGAEPSGSQYKLLGGKGGSLVASSGGGLPRKARIAFYEVAGRPVAVSLSGQSTWASSNLVNCAQELCGMMETMLSGGTPTEGAYLSQLVSEGGGYAAVPVPVDAGAYINAYSVSELLARSDALSRNAAGVQIPASTTKAMTMLCVLSLASDLNEIIEVKSGDMIGGSGSAFDTGDRLTVIDALCVMMMESSNTLAEALGRTFGVKLLRIDEKR